MLILCFIADEPTALINHYVHVPLHGSFNMSHTMSFLVNSAYSVDGPSTFYGKVEAEIDAVSIQRTYLAHSTMMECSWQYQCDKECPLLFATRCVYVFSALPSSSISIYSGCW